jgi:ribosomal protein S18 acetylase RimI-like enzyme
MAADFAVSAAAPDDLPAVLDLWRRAGVAAGATDNGPALRQLLGRDPGSLLVVDAGGRVVGSVIAAWDGWRGGMYRLAVDPERRRLGLARALVAAGEQRLRELGAQRITALVEGEDPRAVAVWRAAGYVRDPRVARYVKDLDGATGVPQPPRS